MSGRIGAIALIFLCTTIAWFLLGSATHLRTDDQTTALKESVQKLWGSAQSQRAPSVSFEYDVEDHYYFMDDGERKEATRTVADTVPARLNQSTINADLNLEHRKKGLQWYPTYTVDFDGVYVIQNPTDSAGKLTFEFPFPRTDGVYDSFVVEINGQPVENIQPINARVTQVIPLAKGESAKIRVAYRSQGMENWWYAFGQNVEKVNNFDLCMTTNFEEINFPDNSMSPTTKTRTADGWKLVWHYSSLISGTQIGMTMPQLLNPGPFVARVCFFAPVSLFLFFFLMFMITTVRNIRMHSMNYFFLATGFFAFHLLLAYLVDHINVHLAMAISSLVSIVLVISYMRLVVGMKFALLETGISQFVYLVLFSYAFFLEGYTGLTITACCILTLFVVMQLTGRIDWEKRFAEINNKQLQRPLAPPPKPV